MARIAPAPATVYAPHFGPDAALSMRIMAQRPELAKAFAEFQLALLRERRLSNRLVELLRIRTAFWNQCRSCMSLRMEDARLEGVDETLVCSLERPQEAPDLSEAERAAIAFADLMATDHHSISDATYDGLREHFTEAEIVEIALNVATMVGFGRMTASWYLVDDLPERYHADGIVTPWGAKDDEVRLRPAWGGAREPAAT